MKEEKVEKRRTRKKLRVDRRDSDRVAERKRQTRELKGKEVKEG